MTQGTCDVCGASTEVYRNEGRERFNRACRSFEFAREMEHSR
jgi:hypothetical protein